MLESLALSLSGKKTWRLYILQRHVQFTAVGVIFLQLGNEPLDTRPQCGDVVRRRTVAPVWLRCGSNYPHCTHSLGRGGGEERPRGFICQHIAIAGKLSSTSLIGCVLCAALSKQPAANTTGVSSGD